MAKLFPAGLAGLLLIAAGFWPYPWAHRAAAQPAPAAPRKRALLVGVSQYNRGPRTPGQRDLDLNAQPDVEALQAVLLRKFGFAPADIKLLTTPQETTHEAITGAFRSFLVTPAGPGDVIYFHFSGHGQSIPDDNKPGEDELDGFDESLVPSDYSLTGPSRNIRDDEIAVLLDELKKKRPSSITLSFDSCFSGTVTRGDGNFQIRGFPAPERNFGLTPAGGQTPEPSGLARPGAALAEGYTVISAARSDQVARETDSDTGGRMGLLSYALVRALEAAGPETTYLDLYERISSVMAQRNRRQTPQLEGNLNHQLMSGVALPPTPFVPVRVAGATLSIPQGRLQGVTPGSRYALYPAGAKDPAQGGPIAEAIAVKVTLTQAALELLPEYQGKIKLAALDNTRAWETAHSYDEPALRVAVRGLAGASEWAAVVKDLEEFPLITVQKQAGAAYDVNAVAEGGKLKLLRADGSQVGDPLAPAPDLARQVRQRLQREAQWRLLSGLDSGNGPAVELRVVAVEVTTRDAEGRPLTVSDKPQAWRRGAGGQLTIATGERVMLEVRNNSPADAFVTVLELRPDGGFGPLWPHPRVPLTVAENLVKADGKWRRVPLPFVFKLTESAGALTFKLIATTAPADFSPLFGINGRAAQGAETPLGRLLNAAHNGQRNFGLLPPAEWATAAATFTVVR